MFHVRLPTRVRKEQTSSRQVNNVDKSAARVRTRAWCGARATVAQLIAFPPAHDPSHWNQCPLTAHRAPSKKLGTRRALDGLALS